MLRGEKQTNFSKITHKCSICSKHPCQTKSRAAQAYPSKPQLTPFQCKVESILLKERRSLIQSGVPTTSICFSINSKQLYVNNQIHGAAKRTFVKIHDPTLDSDSKSESNCDVTQHSEISSQPSTSTAQYKLDSSAQSCVPHQVQTTCNDPTAVCTARGT